MAGPDVDVVITEIGGTVGDIESLPFLEAVRQVRHDVGRDNVFFLHISLVPYIGPSGELKTKPTQHSVAALRSIGIQPDAIVCRSDRDIPPNVKRKISLMCDVDEEAVVAAKDAPSIYDIPKVLHAEGLDAYVVRRLGPAVPRRRLDGVGRPAAPGAPPAAPGAPSRWSASTSTCPTPTCRSPRRCAPAASPTTARCIIRWVTSDDCETPEGAETRARAASTRSASPAASACAASRASSARSATPARTGIPTLGLCLGLQCMVIEYARQRRRPRGRRLAGVRRAHRRTRSSPRWPTRRTSSPASATWAAPCGSGSTRPRCAEGSLAARGLRRDVRRGAAPAPLRGQQRLPRAARAGRPGLLRHLAGRAPGRVRRAAARRAPVLRGHPGAPGVPVPPGPGAPAVRRPGRRRAGPPGRRRPAT